MERFLAKLERKYGRYAISQLTLTLTALQGLVFILELANPGFHRHLVLNVDRVMQGEVWRLITYLIIPPSFSLFWGLFALSIYYMVGTSLEAQWGALKYQVFLLTGMLFTTVAAVLLGIQATNTYLLMSLFLAFGTLFPDIEFRIYFVLPVKVKWLALLDAVSLVLMFFTAEGWLRLMPVLAVGNYLLFFTPTLIGLVRGIFFRADRARAMRGFKEQHAPATAATRSCTLCGVTNVSDPRAEFRVCICDKCGGKPTEFCLAHANAH